MRWSDSGKGAKQHINRHKERNMYKYLIILIMASAQALAIRILDTAGDEGLNIAWAIRDKFAYNQNRADHKSENRKKTGGKKI